MREVWRLPVREDARYRVTQRLELVKRWLLWWNRVDVGDSFRRVEAVEGSINKLQE